MASHKNKTPLGEPATVALGVTGSIAAYKAAELCRLLVKDGREVVVLMTAAALQLVGEATFFTLSRQPVVTDLWETGRWEPAHTKLAERAALLVVAPCTANFIGKFANGIADDALTTYALTHEHPVLLAPAMNPRMWANPAVQANVETLRRRGVQLAGPAAGEVACGDHGVGHLAELAEIKRQIDTLLNG